MELEQKQKVLRRNKSMEVLKSTTHNNLFDGLSEKSRAVTIPGLDIEIDDRLRDFQQYLAEVRRRELDKNNKAEQWEEPESMNIYVSARDPPPEVIKTEGEAQTEQEKAPGELEEESIQRMRDQVRESVNQELLKKRLGEHEDFRNRKKRQQRRGKKSYFENAIDEEDLADSEKSDRLAQGNVPMAYDRANEDMLTLAMQVEKIQSLTSFYDLHQTDVERIQQEKGYGSSQIVSGSPSSTKDMEQLPFPPVDAKGIELSRVSGDLDFSDEEEFNAMYLQNDSEAKRLHEQLKIDNV